MEEKFSGIMLGAVDFGENDKILNIFTLEKGVLSAKIKGVKKAGAKLKFASEPFCFAEYVFSNRSGKRTVIGASAIESFYPLREDIEKFFCGCAALDFIRKFAKEEIVSPALFTLTVKTLKTLSYTTCDARSVLVGFLINALSLSGYALNLSGCFSCGKDISGRVFFDAETGSFLCNDCFSGLGREINLSTFSALKKIADGEEDKEFSVKALRLLDFYITVKADEVIKPIKELIRE